MSKTKQDRMQKERVPSESSWRKAQRYTLAALILCLPLLMFSGISSATIYFVSTEGNDSNSGSSDQAFRHLSKAASIAVAGDTVIVKDGVYDNEAAVAPKYVVSLYNSGTPDQPITFIAEHPGGATLDGMNTVTDGSTCDGAAAYFDIANSSYIIIEGFVITRACDEGIHNNAKAHHITIRQNEIHHIANRFITDQYGREATGCPVAGHDVIIDSNFIHDIGRTNINFTTSMDHGLYMSCSFLTITNNVFYNQRSGWDIQLADSANNVVIANNTFASHNPKQDGQIMLWNGHINLAIRNNIFFYPPRYAVVNYTERIDGCIIESNLIAGSARAYRGTGCSIGINQIDVDPMFVDPASHDYRFSAGSPAIRPGANISFVKGDLTGAGRPIFAPYDPGGYQPDTVHPLSLDESSPVLPKWLYPFQEPPF
jgi:Right handed beta helix region/Pel9A-like, right handed beta helix region